MGEKIDINRERDVGLRLTEVQIVNHDREGLDLQGVIVFCHDDGTITLGKVQDWRDGLLCDTAVDQSA